MKFQALITIKLCALILISISGCAVNDPVYTVCEKRVNYASDYCELYTQTEYLKHLADVEKSAIAKKKEQEAEEQQRLLAQQEADKAAAEEAKRIYDLDESKGFKHMSIEDFLLDAKEMRPFSQVVLSGYYRIDGKIETIGLLPAESRYSVPLLTEAADRDSRKLLMGFNCQQAFCPVTILGLVSKCEITSYGMRVSSGNVCVLVTKVRMPNFK
ncbi:MAG: hypothetical protein WC856_10075 [Methylococcaceae bacterium]|jgi:hypothetical protein